MKKYNTIIFIMFFLFISSGSVFCESKDILEIRKLFNEAENLQKETTNYLTLVEIFEGEGSVSNWTVEKKDDNFDSVMSRCIIFFDKGRVFSVSMFETSPSGDWVKYTNYYFYENGNTAFIYATLNTFYGSVTVERRLYYDKNMKNIKELKDEYKLGTKEPLSATGDDPDDVVGYMDNPPEIFLNVQEFIQYLMDAKVHS